MKKKNKLILVESEMIGPRGHFLDNLIETTKNFEKKLNISWIVNKRFNNEGTYLPKNIKIIKAITSNTFRRKNNKIFYIFEEILFFVKNIYWIIYFFISFSINGNLKLFLSALKSNYFILPKYFSSFYKQYKALKLSTNDNIFFQTARRKDIALINFLIKIDKKHPKFHVRVMLPPKIKFKGFFYYLNLLKAEMINKKLFIYTWSDYNYNHFLKNCSLKKGIYKSNIPWSFYKRTFKKKKYCSWFCG